MLKPESLKAKPADNYKDLKRQFFALKRLCESKINQCDIYSRKLAEHDLESVIARNEAIESEREMNAQLTEELEKANERIVELESHRKRNLELIKALFYAPSSPVTAKKAKEIEDWFIRFEQLRKEQYGE